MKRKLYDELNLKDPFLHSDKFSKKRNRKWRKERKKYGFDERETWDIRYTFVVWLYERLYMYNIVSIVDTNFHKVEIFSETKTLQGWIDFLILESKYIIENYDDSFFNDEFHKRIDNLKIVFCEVLDLLWW